MTGGAGADQFTANATLIPLLLRCGGVDKVDITRLWLRRSVPYTATAAGDIDNAGSQCCGVLVADDVDFDAQPRPVPLTASRLPSSISASALLVLIKVMSSPVVKLPTP